MMSVQLKLKAFEGPLDLLCHLIRINEIDIYDIPMTEITRQYMNYLAAMKSFQMETTSEFLVMAATLMEIKSRMLLPAPRKSQAEEDLAVGEEGEDPRQELVEKLLEYERYQQAADFLKQLENEGLFLYSKPAEDLSMFLKKPGDQSEEEVSLKEMVEPELLMQTFRQLMERFVERHGEEELDRHFIPIPRETFTIQRQSREILDALRDQPQLSFVQFFQSMQDRRQMIVTFLSLLELMKDHQVRVQKAKESNDLLICLQAA